MLRACPTRAGRLLVATLAVAAAIAVPNAGEADRASELRARADQLRAETAALAERSHDALLELYAFDTQLTRARARLAALETEAASVRRERARARRHLATVRRTSRAARKSLAARVRALYEQGGIDPLAVILGASSFDDALTRLDHAARVADQDRFIAAQARAAQARFTRLARALAAREVKLRQLQEETRLAAASLEQARAEREGYVARLTEQQRFNESEISELEEQAQIAEEKARQEAEERARAAAA
ncbi:MAG: hypothetical protein M3292_00205, partial [Actinomycetota bacterium]|nr:hypothetical protein [Actinomycetota bacterium]